MEPLKKSIKIVTLLIIASSVLLAEGNNNEVKEKETKSSLGKKHILFLLPLSSKSHKNVFEPLIRGLAAKGHEITVIAATKSPNMPPNVREIVIVKDEEIYDDWEDPLENRKKGRFGNMFMDISFALSVGERVFESKEIQELLKTHKGKFDLAFVDLILNQCFYGLLTYFESPVITLCTLTPWNAITTLMGSRLPPSFVPISFLNLPEKMTFVDRVKNHLMDWMSSWIMRLYYNTRMEKVYQKYLGDDYPEAEVIEANASIMLTNSHFSLNPKLPLLPDIVEVGGMHLKPSKPLPKELEDFLKDADDGFIFFSLGTIVRARNMPDETRKTFLRVFSKLKQKVIWKWEQDSMPDTPPNVKISKWLPQQDILGHPKLKLFMTHGGLLSLQEAVYHGIPVLGLPVFGDQDLNVLKAVDGGFGLFQEILDVKENELLEKINTLITQPQYGEKVKDLSKILKDQPQSPLERAIFWSEYVMRHNGAHHLRSPARDLHWFQYHSVDVISFLLGIVVTVVLLVVCICRKLCCSSKKTQVSDKNRRKKLN